MGPGHMMERMPVSAAERTIQLFDLHRSPLLRYLLSLRLSVPDAEEVVQEVFLALYEHLRKDKPQSNLRAWLFTVAHNLGLKRRARDLRVVAIDPPDTADASPGPEELFADAQRQHHLRAIVRALPEQDQYVLALRAEGLAYREISRILGISPGSVANSLERSIERLTRARQRVYVTRG